MTRSTTEVLRDAFAHFERLQAYAAGGLADQLVIDAICMRLSAGIETLVRLDPEVLAQLFGDTWPEMWGMRNRIAHGYLLVDTTIVSQTIQDDIPQIVAAISAELDGAAADRRVPSLGVRVNWVRAASSVRQLRQTQGCAQ